MNTFLKCILIATLVVVISVCSCIACNYIIFRNRVAFAKGKLRDLRYLCVVPAQNNTAVEFLLQIPVKEKLSYLSVVYIPETQPGREFRSADSSEIVAYSYVDESTGVVLCNNLDILEIRWNSIVFREDGTLFLK